MSDHVGAFRTGPPWPAIYNDDAFYLARYLPDDSIDLCFTDPPYGRDALPLYWQLGRIAARVLKPGRFLLCMTGGLYLDEIIAALGQGLRFFYLYGIMLTDTAGAKTHPLGSSNPVINRTKPILAFTKHAGRPTAYPRTVIYSPFAGDGNDKRWHYWGQEAKSTRYFVDCFSYPGDVVLDPFSGGGTTPMVCRALGRRWLAFEVDPVAAHMSRQRVRGVELPLFAHAGVTLPLFAALEAPDA
jgi:site-specific DNA-methyltransferase (adenine-specific)